MKRSCAHPHAAAGPARVAAILLAALMAGATAQFGGCASPQASSAVAGAGAGAGAEAAASAAGPASAASAAAARGGTAPPGPPPFAEVTRDAKTSTGFLDVWTKDDKTWLEIPAERLNQPFFFGISLASGLGERFFWPGLMAGDQIVVLRRVGNNVQLLARNMHARAPDGTPLARAVAESYSDSLLAAAPLAAAPHPERKSLLVDASVLLGGDLFNAQTRLEEAYHLPYSLDRSNSSIEHAGTQVLGTTVKVRSHFSIPKLPAAPVPVPGGPPPTPAGQPDPPRVVPEARSLFLSFAYTLAPLPEPPMRPRQADQRVGYFTDAYVDFGDDNGGDRRKHLIHRWRLEKKDPAAAVSEPVQPIRAVMDRNIPERWRAPIRAGILEWNKAFEKAGFRAAISVEQQPADADWSSLEGSRILAVRWFALEGPGAVAVGPSQSDPRSGEILRAAVIIPENWVRIFRANARDTEPRLPPVQDAAPSGSALAVADGTQCAMAQGALEDAQFAFELLAARGELDPNGPEAERFIAQSLKDVTMHEVGHALGLRHNFKASTAVTRAQLRDPAFTALHGISNSVMDYNGLNVPLQNEAIADYHMTTLGAYDEWAIEYGYRELAPATEMQELAQLAGRSDTDPGLAYGTDEDVVGIDPTINQRDLGDDPLAYADRQLTLTHELWSRTQSRQLAGDDDMAVYRRNLQRGFNTIAAAVPTLAKYLGGTYTSRALAGAQQPLLTPVDAVRQRAALHILLDEVFAAGSFRFDPGFMSRLGVDQLDRVGPNRFVANVDFSLPTAVLGIQRGTLDILMSDGLAGRLADAEDKVADRSTLLSYAEVQSRLSAAVWSELKDGKAARDIDSLRRNLQREHLRRLAAGLLRGASSAAADVRSVHRQVALELDAELKAALKQPHWNAMARAHIADCEATLAEALRAPLLKQGV